MPNLLNVEEHRHDLGDIVLRVQNFRAWLESKKPTDSVGWRGDCWACPVYQWLYATIDNKLRVARVDGTNVSLHVYHGWDTLVYHFHTPTWIRGFIEYIDRGSAFGSP